MTLLGVKRHQRPLIVAAGLFGAALIYGDAALARALIGKSEGDVADVEVEAHADGVGGDDVIDLA